MYILLILHPWKEYTNISVTDHPKTFRSVICIKDNKEEKRNILVSVANLIFLQVAVFWILLKFGICI